MSPATPYRPRGRQSGLDSARLMARYLGWRIRHDAGELHKEIAAEPGDGVLSPIHRRTVIRGIAAANRYLAQLVPHPR